MACVTDLGSPVPASCMDYDNHHPVDPYMGFSGEIISLLRRASRLPQHDTRDQNEFEIVQAEIEQMYVA
jgi:hypothetical protein